METRITRRLEFDAGHRVLGHEGKCKHVHGHRYAAEITVVGTQLDTLSRVIDFGVVKEIVGKWIDENWDHNFLCHHDDPIVLQAQHLRSPREEAAWYKSVLGRTPFIMPNGTNPTAEAMARFLYFQAQNLLLTKPVAVQRIRLYETPNCWADFPSQVEPELVVDPNMSAEGGPA